MAAETCLWIQARKFRLIFLIMLPKDVHMGWKDHWNQVSLSFWNILLFTCHISYKFLKCLCQNVLCLWRIQVTFFKCKYILLWKYVNEQIL